MSSRPLERVADALLFFLLLGLSFLGLSLVKWISCRWVEKNGNPLERSLVLLEPHSQWGWQQKRGLDVQFYGYPFRTNSLGLRSSELPLQGPWILVAGPSSAVGWGVAEEQTYSAVLERLLQANPATRDWRVINGGEIGFSSVQGLRWLRQPEFWRNPPRVVIWSYGINDLDLHRFFFDSARDDIQEFAQSKSGIEMMRHSLVRWLYPLPALAARLRPAHPASSQSSSAVRRVSDEEFAQAIEEFDHLANERNFFPLLVSTVYRIGDSPVPEQMRINRDTEQLDQTLRQTAQRLSMPCVDLAVAFGPSRWNDRFVDPVHFSEFGHKRVAESLFEALKNAMNARGMLGAHRKD